MQKRTDATKIACEKKNNNDTSNALDNRHFAFEKKKKSQHLNLSTCVQNSIINDT